MPFIENDAAHMLLRIPAGMKAAYYHDDEIHVRQIIEARAKMWNGSGCRNNSGVDHNHFQSASNRPSASAGVGYAGAWHLQRII